MKGITFLCEECGKVTNEGIAIQNNGGTLILFCSQECIDKRLDRDRR